MTGKAREHEARLMGVGLAAMALLAAATIFWGASAIGHQLHLPADGGAAVTQGSSGS
jgi:hypothetical protein